MKYLVLVMSLLCPNLPQKELSAILATALGPLCCALFRVSSRSTPFFLFLFIIGFDISLSGLDNLGRGRFGVGRALRGPPARFLLDFQEEIYIFAEKPADFFLGIVTSPAIVLSNLVYFGDFVPHSDRFLHFFGHPCRKKSPFLVSVLARFGLFFFSARTAQGEE